MQVSAVLFGSNAEGVSAGQDRKVSRAIDVPGFDLPTPSLPGWQICRWDCRTQQMVSSVLAGSPLHPLPGHSAPACSQYSHHGSACCSTVDMTLWVMASGVGGITSMASVGDLSGEDLSVVLTGSDSGTLLAVDTRSGEVATSNHPSITVCHGDV